MSCIEASLEQPSVLKARIGATVNLSRKSGKKGQQSNSYSGIVVSIDPISKR